jgi:CRISPR-associated endoribonuclease Cas6
MNFKITLFAPDTKTIIPINYQYPLSAAIYRILAKGDRQYADFLHDQGYGKGFKLFTFSQINVPFAINGDRLELKNNEANFMIAFHLPQAIESFVKGLFQSERIDIADRKSKARFTVKSIESLPNYLQKYKENEIVNVQLRVLSPVVAGLPNEKGNYNFLDPLDNRFTDSLVYNWRNKIASCFSDDTGKNAFLMLETRLHKNPPKSRLIWIKADTEHQTKIRGWFNLGFRATAEKRFVELLLNSGAGLYNAQGMGCVEGIDHSS